VSFPRRVLRSVLLFLLHASLVQAAAPGQVATAPEASAAFTSWHAGAASNIEAVGAVGMTVLDMDRSVRFFVDILGFEKVSEAEVDGEAYEHLEGVFGLRMRVARLRLGKEMLELTEYLAPGGRPVPADSHSNDLWFQHAAIVVSDMQRAYRLLRDHRVEHASSGPQRLPDWNKAAGGIEAFYFRDPDGHFLEVIHFPTGKGEERWQNAEGKIFLGIDHTAIVVHDTEASLRFYRDALGMRVAGESENYGTEQEHLNNVFGARLRITALRAASGPGIELLEYLAPSGGRPYPPDSRAGDLWQWQTHLATSGADRTARVLKQSGSLWISPGAVELPDSQLGFRAGALLRDPDGHALLLEQR
jgi:catechol 2,3-dioxygenase-like lactoylglutathione lyase family enzyme